MFFDEKTLRQMLASPYGESCGNAMLDSVAAGQPVTIAMVDGRTLTLSDHCTVINTLRELFGCQIDEEAED
jgi:hypothetical protein